VTNHVISSAEFLNTEPIPAQVLEWPEALAAAVEPRAAPLPWHFDDATAADASWQLPEAQHTAAWLAL
jgi:hypothetical protein